MKFFNVLNLWLVAATVGLLSSCTERSDYLSAVPVESAFTMKVNVANLLEKSEVMESQLVRNNLDEAVNELSGSAKRVVEEAIRNPASTGIDFRRPVVMAMEDLQRPQVMVLFAVDDAGKLTDFIETLIDDDEMNLPVELNETDGGVRTLTDKRGTVVGAYDATRLVFAYGKRGTDASEYLKLPEKRQAIASDDFKAFVRAKEDMAIYYDYEAILRMNPYFVSTSENNRLLDGMKALFTTNFEAGRIAFTAEVFGNETLEELNQKTNIRPTGKNLCYVPTKNYGVINGGLRNLSETIEYMPSEIRQMIDRGFESVGTTEAILNKLDGDFTLAVLPMQQLGYEQLPQFFVAAECSGRELFDLVIDNFSENGSGLTAVSENVYGFNVNGQREDGFDYYFAYKNNTIFLLPENLYAQIADGDRFKALGDNFTENPLAGTLKGKSGAVVDFRTIAEDIERHGCLDNIGGIAMKYLNLLQDMTITQKNTTASEGAIDFIDTKTNALKQLTDVTLKLAGEVEQ